MKIYANVENKLLNTWQILTLCEQAPKPGGIQAQHPLGHENPLKSIEFTGPGGA